MIWMHKTFKRIEENTEIKMCMLFTPIYMKQNTFTSTYM